jgi:O-antigen ligase
MGIPALLVFLSILVFMFRIAWRSYRASPDLYWKTLSIVALCSITSLVITNMFGSRVFSLVLTGYLWMLLAILLKMPRWAERRAQKTREEAPELGTPARALPSFSRFAAGPHDPVSGFIPLRREVREP